MINAKKSNWIIYLFYFSWLISLIATLGSLYFSEIKGFIPCELCWYQRTLMYPLAIILGIATFLKDISIVKYILPLSVIGFMISLIHYLMQKSILSFQVKPCMNSIPCDTIYINWFGFITIPFLALIAFGIISICLTTIVIKFKK
jgi:disulfide bond formation protein DsbB